MHKDQLYITLVIFGLIFMAGIAYIFYPYKTKKEGYSSAGGFVLTNVFIKPMVIKKGDETLANLEPYGKGKLNSTTLFGIHIGDTLSAYVDDEHFGDYEVCNNEEILFGAISESIERSHIIKTTIGDIPSIDFCNLTKYNYTVIYGNNKFDLKPGGCTRYNNKGRGFKMGSVIELYTSGISQYVQLNNNLTKLEIGKILNNREKMMPYKVDFATSKQSGYESYGIKLYPQI